MNLTRVLSLVELRVETFTVEQTTLKAASSKMVKHEKSYYENQHAFIPFSFDTFCFLAPDVVNHLQRVKSVMNSDVVSPRAMNVIFKRIDFVQKGLAMQLVARLSFIHM
jgi:hypothetical protein